MCIQTAVFSYWHILCIPEEDQPEGAYTEFNILRWILVFFAIYFIQIEFLQMARSAEDLTSTVKEYFTPDNVFDLLPNVLIIIQCIYVEHLWHAADPEERDIHFSDFEGNNTDEVMRTADLQFSSYKTFPNANLFWSLQAITGLAVWFKFWIFLRVFDSTSFLV